MIFSHHRTKKGAADIKNISAAPLRFVLSLNFHILSPLEKDLSHNKP